METSAFQTALKVFYALMRKNLRCFDVEIYQKSAVERLRISVTDGTHVHQKEDKIFY